VLKATPALPNGHAAPTDNERATGQAGLGAARRRLRLYNRAAGVGPESVVADETGTR